MDQVSPQDVRCCYFDVRVLMQNLKEKNDNRPRGAAQAANTNPIAPVSHHTKMFGAPPITELLRNIDDGNREALDSVFPLVYDELKKLARSHLRREANAGALQTTALVHEAFLKLAGGRHPCYESRGHFYGITSRLMRQILVDTARARSVQKRSNVEE